MNKKRLTIALISLSAMILLIAAVLAIKSGKILKINISLVDIKIEYMDGEVFNIGQSQIQQVFW